MEEKNNVASFEVDIRSGIIKISGPVSFVENQINIIRKDMNIMEAIADYKPPMQLTSSQMKDIPSKTPNEGNLSKYENVLSIDSSTGKIHILTTFTSLPKASATMEIALIYGWAKKQMGIDIIPTKEIRDACQDHGVLDQANFASHIDKHKSLFIVDKSSGNYSIKLTTPGIKQAELLLEKYNQN